MTVPRVTRVEILWSNLDSLAPEDHDSIADAETAIARALQEEPDDTLKRLQVSFRVVWSDGFAHGDGVSLQPGSSPGPVLRTRLYQVAKVQRDVYGKSRDLSEEERAQRRAQGNDMFERLRAEEPAVRNSGEVRAGRGLPYAGTRVPTLRGPRSRLDLPSPAEATLLPDPRMAHAELLDRFREVNGPLDEPAEFPNLSARDARALTNLITFALRNDLSSIDPHDAAVIWEKWRQAVDNVREHLGHVRDDNVTNKDSSAVFDAQMVLQHRGWDVLESIVTSLRSPGDVFAHYCPWRADWATYERIYPRAA